MSRTGTAAFLTGAPQKGRKAKRKKMKKAVSLAEGSDDDQKEGEEVGRGGYTLPLEVLARVPCSNTVRGCNFVGATYQEVNRHVEEKCTHKQAIGPYKCAWSPE